MPAIAKHRRMGLLAAIEAANTPQTDGCPKCGKTIDSFKDGRGFQGHKNLCRGKK